MNFGFHEWQLPGRGARRERGTKISIFSRVILLFSGATSGTMRTLFLIFALALTTGGEPVRSPSGRSSFRRSTHQSGVPAARLADAGTHCPAPLSPRSFYKRYLEAYLAATLRAFLSWLSIQRIYHGIGRDVSLRLAVYGADTLRNGSCPLHLEFPSFADQSRSGNRWFFF
jgi:hypothetical protein